MHVVQLHVNILLEHENNLLDGHVSFPAVGHYNLGSRTFSVFGRHSASVLPQEDHRVVLFCVFDGFNQDRCDGHLEREASGDVCAELIFVRHNGSILLFVLTFLPLID